MAPTQGGHVMISYQWDSQQEVLRIKTSLEESGYNVWMDLDEMQGNIFEKMAEGVENASLMIIAMTSKYESSINCNRELQYSQVKRKKIVPIKLEENYNPKGALGLIVAGAIYVDFSDTSKFTDNISSLKREIDSALGKTGPVAAPAMEHHETKDHPMRVSWVEQRSGSWNGAADKIINALKAKNAKRNQVVAISAHNNGATSDAIFAAFYDLNEPGDGDLNLAYEFQNEAYAWKKFYEKTSQQIHGLKGQDVISLTGSCNEKDRSVFYSFIQFPSFGSCSANFVESRANSWNGAANQIIGDLVSKGVKRGQLLSIDAHSNGADEAAIFSAFWDNSRPSLGPLSIGYKCVNGEYAWSKFYNDIAMECNKLKRKDFISITASINCRNTSVMYLFYYQ